MADHHHAHHHDHHHQQPQPQPQQPQPSGFWTLTRPSKLSKRRTNSDLHELHHKVFNICVVGLSGVEKDRGPIGIGKSCLCNRFVRSAADDYYTDHISVLSQSDFSGRVVNNDHWLYWGSVIKSCDGYDLAFNVIEQTEFVDDACFQPFKSGKTEPYFKRCANTKLVSAEKLMYICKNQLGIEREYEQRYLPDGKFNVDGFLCLFDVSEVHERNIDKQIEMTNLIMLNLIKTKKPVVFVTTKHDEASEILVAEAERLVNQPDFRGLVPIVETSAQENVNINIAFLVCAQMIDKTRTKLRIPPYYEASKNHRDLLNTASDAYLNLIQSTVIDFRTTWQQVCIKLSHNPEFLQYTYLHGLDRATLVFNNHLKRLHDDCINQRVQHYLRLFPDILDELIPIDQVRNNNHNNNVTEQPYIDSSPQAWQSTKEQLRSHPLYNKFFIPVPAGISWHDTELIQSTDNRIPSDWLDSEQALSIFQRRNMILETECKRKVAKTMFANMLHESKIPVGQPFIELKSAFEGDPTLKLLSDQELFEVYVEYQNQLLQRARADFQELLLENAEHLQHLTSSNKVIRQEDIKTINTILQHDERYQALDRFDQDRTLMMIRHLSFLHSQISEQCPSHPTCVEPEIERLLITKAKNIVSRFYESRQDGRSGSQPQKSCDLIILGPRRPSQQLILALNVLNSRAPKESQYQITFTVFDNADEVDSQLQRFRQSDTKPKGCFGIFTNRRSLDHVDYTLGKFLSLSSQVQNDKKNFGSPPVVMLYAADITLDERTMLALENEGQQVADRFRCPFMNVTAIDQYRQHQQNNILSSDQEIATQVMSECASLDYACVDAAFNVLKEAISRRVCFMDLYNNQELIPRQAFSPDARILMCLLCGEPFSNERYLWQMFLEYEDCYVTSSKSICLKVKLEDGQDRFIEIIITSYTHGALNHREELLHGFILVCSIERRASLSILNAFSFNIPCTPTLVVAISGGRDDTCQDSLERTNLMKEAQSVATRLKGHFKLMDLQESQDSAAGQTLGIQRIRSFLLSVIKRKPMIERAYELGDVDLQDLTQSFSYLQDSAEHNGTHLGGNADIRTFRGHHNPDEDLSESPSDDNDPKPDPRSLVHLKSTGNRAPSSKPDEIKSRKLPDQLAPRPLPPIPSSSEPAPQEVGSKYAPRTFNDKIHHQQKQINGQAIPQTSLQDENYEGSSSTDDTEDSTDKNSKPKPGKLDLRQFDNITNAIGKLNVQSKKAPPELNVGPSKSSKHQASAATSEAESGYFKSRSKKVRNKVKESSPKEESQVVIEKSASSVNKLKKHSSKQSISAIESRTANIAEAIGEGSHNSIADREIKSSDISITARSSRFQSENDQQIRTPTFSGPAKSNPNNQELPRPAPRSSQSAQSSTSSKAPTVSVASSSASTKTSPSSTSVINSTASSSKPRLTNMRQNHGRAVAPPQLPGGHMSGVLSSGVHELDASRLTDKPSNYQSKAEELGVDFSQSPIAQRLLKYSKDYKVSELNSPGESDSEQTPTLTSFRNKLHKGPSLDSGKASSHALFPNASIDSSELINAKGAAIKQLNEILANKQPHGRFAGARPLSHSRGSSFDQEQEPSSQTESAKKKDKDSKKDKKKLRDDEKSEKKRQKEEERLRRQEKKLAAKKLKGGDISGNIDDDGIPLFIRRCIEFIEYEGLDAEGIYRVPGNRAHVDAFVQKFKDNPDMSIVVSDIPVNAVATALKDFLSKKWGPIIPLDLMNELTALSSISDKDDRMEAVRHLVRKLPQPNYNLLRYVFAHFVKVSLNHSLNSMDSKNLAICWWPTLLPLHFSDMVMFEQMRPHLEESVQTMIDHYDYIFEDDTSPGAAFKSGGATNS